MKVAGSKLFSTFGVFVITFVWTAAPTSTAPLSDNPLWAGTYSASDGNYIARVITGYPARVENKVR